MAQDYASSVTGSHIRITRLQADGKFATGASASYVSKSFISVSFTPEYEDGDEFTQKAADGSVCVTYKAPDTLKRVNLSLAICNPDPIFTAMIAGGALLGDSGWAAPKVGEDPNPHGVAIEVWSKAIIDGKPAATPYFHWVFPYTKMRESGERVIQNDILATEFEGWGVGNLGFASGPAAPVWGYAPQTDRPYAYARSLTVPVLAGGASSGYATATNS